jgi:hypothetical protein
VLCENFGVAPKPQGFRITDDGLEDGPAPTVPLEEEEETDKDRAEKWLRIRMEPGVSYPSATIIEEAEAAGFSRTGTLQRARKALRVESVKMGKQHFLRRPPQPGESVAESTAESLAAGPRRYTYALTDGTAIKVGKSDQQPTGRVSELQTGNPRPLTLLAWTLKLTEAQVKERLAADHDRGEWFKPSPAVLAEIAGWDWSDEAELTSLRDGITPPPA